MTAGKGDCEALATKAATELASAHAAAGKSCARDDDCAFVLTSLCPPGCDVAAVAKPSERSFRDAVERVGGGPCAEWRDRDCMRISGAPFPSCMPHVPVCTGGTCAARPMY
jgi:hypothetical protein